MVFFLSSLNICIPRSDSYLNFLHLDELQLKFWPMSEVKGPPIEFSYRRSVVNRKDLFIL